MAPMAPSFLTSTRLVARIATLALLVLALPGWNPLGERGVQAADDTARAEQKVDSAQDQAAGKEMEVARYYLGKRDYTGAINRCRIVVTRYRATRHVEEALKGLTEAYLMLGIVDEAQTAAAVLRHNFPDSRWLKDAYDLLKSRGLEPRKDEGSWMGWIFK